jgi:hypothetical protein
MSAKASDSPFSVAMVIGLVVTGLICLIGVATLTAFGPELRSGNDGKTHALSRSAIGFKGLVTLLESVGYPVLVRKQTNGAALDEHLVVYTPGLSDVLAPEVGGSDDEAGAVNDAESAVPFDYDDETAFDDPALDYFRSDREKLLILPKWNYEPDEEKAGWVRLGAMPDVPGAITPRLPPGLQDEVQIKQASLKQTVLLLDTEGAPFAEPVSINRLQTIKAQSLIPLVTNQAGEVIVGREPLTSTTIVADPDFLNTQGLATINGAKTALAIIALAREPGQTIVFDLSQHGFGAERNVLRLMVEPPFAGATLCLLVAGLLAAFAAGVRFRPVLARQRSVAFGKRALADSTAGLVQLAKREPLMAKPYIALIRRAAARATGAPRALKDGDLDAYLDRASTNAGLDTTFSATIATADDAKSAAGLLKFARTLHRWKMELTRDRTIRRRTG